MRKINKEAFEAFYNFKPFSKQNRHVEVLRDEDGKVANVTLSLYNFKFLNYDVKENVLYERTDSNFSFSGSHTTAEFKNDIDRMVNVEYAGILKHLRED